MSKVGNVDKMYGSAFSFVTTNASGTDIMNDSDSNFVAASLIIASPIDGNGNDLGYPVLLCTDDEGKPLRLTYTIKPGNGLVLAYAYAPNEQDYSDVLSLAIDHDTLQTSNGDGSGYLFVSAAGITEHSQYLSVDEANNMDVDIRELADGNKVVITHVPVSSSPTSPIIARLSVDASKLVDNYTLKTNQSTAEASASYFAKQKISVNLANIVDKKSIVVITNSNGQSVMAVDTSYMTPATGSRYGVVKVDGDKIITNGNGQITVKTDALTAANKNGTPGIVKVDKDNKGSINVSNTGLISVNTQNLTKCTTNEYGVCKVDGNTIYENKGVLKVSAENLDRTSNNNFGVCKPDNKSITAYGGVLSVNMSALNSCSETSEGVVKYDGSTLQKNGQGQLAVSKAAEWDAAISDLNTKISNLDMLIASMKSDLTNVLAALSKSVDTPFNIYTIAGVPLSTISVRIPNISNFKNGVHAWDTANCGGSFKITYGAGYTFSVRLTGGTSFAWIQGCNIIVNGQTYGMNQDIKLDTNDAQCSLELMISGYGSVRTSRTQASFSLEFKDQVGNPLKAVNVYVNNPVASIKQSDFLTEFNKNSALDMGGIVPQAASAAFRPDILSSKVQPYVKPNGYPIIK